MTKYHFNKDTGRTGKCEAKIQCRLGLAEAEHFGTREEAQAAFEKTMDNKNTSAVRKSRAKKLDTVKFNVDVYSYKQDKNLNGKTVAEYRQFIREHLNEYSGRTKEIQDNIVDTIGLSDLDLGYADSVRVLDKDEIELTHRLTENTFDLPFDQYEGYIYDQEAIDNIDPEKYLDSEFVNNEHYIRSRIYIGGYYNEEQEVIVYYEIPEELQNDAEGLLNAEKYSEVAEVANNPAFPDWAVVPENVTLDKKPKTFDNPRFQQRPNYPDGKIAAFRRYLNPERETERLTKLANSTERNLEKTKRRIEAIKEVKKSNPYSNPKNRTDYRIVSDFSGDPANLTKTQRDMLVKRLEDKAASNESTLAGQRQRLADIKKLTPQEEASANQNIINLQNEYKEKVHQYTVEKLSRNYPSSDESLRKREAEKWVNAHPEILEVKWF